MAKRWSPEEDELLLKLRQEGFSSKEIAIRLPERSYASVRMRLSQIATDNQKRPWTEEEKELAIELRYKERKPIKHIARTLNRTEAAVSSFFYKLNSSKSNLDDK
jgi:transposase-like protein